MWELVSVNNPCERFCFVLGKQYIVGRKDCEVLISGDQSISRKHATIEVVHAEANLSQPHKPSQLKINEESKFGTELNGKQIKGEEHKVEHGNLIKFGTLNSKYRASYEPFVITASCLNAESKKKTKQSVFQLGGHMVNDWRKECTLLVMTNLSVTIKVVCALVSLKRVVTPEYLQDLYQAKLNKTKEPDPDDYLPPLAESQLDPSEVSFKVNERRTVLFQGKIFVFLSPKQFNKLSLAIELAGGTPMLLEEGTDDNTDDIIQSPNTCVMMCEGTANAQTTSQNAHEWRHHVRKVLMKKKRRFIQDSELGYSVLYCSTEKYCNPNKDPGMFGSADLPSQSLSQAVDISTQKSQPREKNTCVVPKEEKNQEPKEKVTIKTEPQTPGKTKGREVVVADLPTSSRKRSRHEDTADTMKEEPAFIKKETVTPVKPRQKTAETNRDTENTCEIGMEDDFDMAPSHKRRKRKKSPSPVPSPKNPSPEIRQSSRVKRSPTPVSDTDVGIEKPKTPRGRNKRMGDSSASDVDRDITTATSPARNTRSRSPAPISDVEFDFEEPPKRKRTRKSPSPKPSGGITPEKTKSDTSSKVMEDIKIKQSESSKKKKNSSSERQAEVVQNEDQASTSEGHTTSHLQGFLTTTRPIRDQVGKSTDFIKEEDLPCRVVQTEVRSLLVRTAKQAKKSLEKIGDSVMWHGKQVRNFKKFRKCDHVGAGGLPNIIGGTDLVLHKNGARDVEEWFKDELVAESEKNEMDEMARELFDYEPSGKRGSKESASSRGRKTGRKLQQTKLF